MVKHIVYIEGDVLKSDERIIVHGCNCFNTMGSGIARQIRERFPEAYAADVQTTWGDKLKLGRFTDALCENAHGNPVHVINAYTQYKYTRTEVDVDYDALKSALTRVCLEFRNKVVALPKIGCGLAGGDWEVVEEILESIGIKFNMTFHVYEWGEGSIERQPKKSTEEAKADNLKMLERFRAVLDKEYAR
jgi:O-acetyl-ADP-ribose deacetylase (regulator of RNase III)